MFKKLIELKQKRAAALAKAKEALMKGEADAHTDAMNEIEDLNKRIENVNKILDEERRFSEGEETPLPGAAKKTAQVDGFHVMSKVLRGQKLTEAEAATIGKALVTGEDAENGEGSLLPVDVQTKIRELRRSYVSLKDLVNVVPTTALSGSVPVATGARSGLTKFKDGEAIAEGPAPKFNSLSYTIEFAGALMPVSRILAAQAGGLTAYLDKWFVANAVLTENADIIVALFEPFGENNYLPIADLTDLGKMIITELNAASRAHGVIVTNQSGYAAMGAEKDLAGRSLLQPDPTNADQLKYKGMLVYALDDSELPNIDETHAPVICGDLKGSCDFIEYEGIAFSVSEHFYFNRNQNCLRVTEGYDVVAADSGGYFVGSYALS